MASHHFINAEGKPRLYCKRKLISRQCSIAVAEDHNYFITIAAAYYTAGEGELVIVGLNLQKEARQTTCKSEAKMFNMRGETKDTSSMLMNILLWGYCAAPVCS